MQTKRLYELDPLLKEAPALVLSCDKEQDNWRCVFDATPFFPEGGGQPCDTGWAGQVRITDVQSAGEHIVHTTGGPLTVGRQVNLSIDWPRRFDLMQHHSAEHLLSGLALSLYGARNVGFHLSCQSCHVDFDRPLSGIQIGELERAINDAIVSDSPVHCFYPEHGQLDEWSFRSKPERIQGPIRLVEFPGIDVCACCGVHVPSTGMIGQAKILDYRAYKGGMRLTLSAGRRALDAFDLCQQQIDSIGRLLSAKREGCAAAVERLSLENDSLKQSMAQLEDRLFEVLLKDSVCSGQVVVCRAQNLDSAQLRALAIKMSERQRGDLLCVTLSGDHSQTGFVLVCPQRDVRALCRQLTDRFNGKGGGKPHLAEGKVQAGTDEVETFLRQGELLSPGF